MNEPSDHAISLFSEMLQNCQDRENRRTQLMPSDIDVIVLGQFASPAALTNSDRTKLRRFIIVSFLTFIKLNHYRCNSLFDFLCKNIDK
jgi:hypothetical protein